MEHKHRPRFHRAGTAQRGARADNIFSRRAVSARVSPRHWGRQCRVESINTSKFTVEIHISTCSFRDIFPIKGSRWFIRRNGKITGEKNDVSIFLKIFRKVSGWQLVYFPWIGKSPLILWGVLLLGWRHHFGIKLKPSRSSHTHTHTPTHTTPHPTRLTHKHIHKQIQDTHTQTDTYTQTYRETYTQTHTHPSTYRHKSRHPHKKGVTDIKFHPMLQKCIKSWD